MFTIFNRKELITTFDFEKLNRVRDILDYRKIVYLIRVKNMNKSRGRTGNFGINPQYMYQYTLYVKKRDYDKAEFVIK